jgi:putative AlgH/UPF0301 family transcriptional regulator
MSLRKLCFFTVLAGIVVCAARGGPDPRSIERDRPRTNEQPRGPALAADESLFLPVQSKNLDGLRAGKLLVASRGLADPNFAKTVILLVQYDAQGVVGLILNRRTTVPVSRALESFKAAKDRSDSVYLGGPVDTSAVFGLLKSPARIEGAERIFGTVYVISDRTLFEQTIATRPDPGIFHVYLGYAGWASAQLRMEVELGAWFIFPGDAGTVFNADPDSLWPQMIRQTELKMAGNEPAKVHQSARAEKAADELKPWCKDREVARLAGLTGVMRPE